VLRRWIPRDLEPRVATRPNGGAPIPETAPGSQDGAASANDVRTAPPTEDLARLDNVTVVRLRGTGAPGRPSLYSRLAELFRTGSSAALDELQAALGGGDLSAARAICHKLKSSAANVGAKAFSEDVRRLEQLCAAGNASAASSVFERLRSVHPMLISELTAAERKESA
jgi:HPt (histidine-containing phosphotransfer) domain-containing protein